MLAFLFHLVHFTAAQSHTIVVDGSVSDFFANETYNVASISFTGNWYFTMDVTKFYLGLSSNAVSSPSDLYILIVYFDTISGGSTTGIAEGGLAAPTLAGPADFALEFTFWQTSKTVTWYTWGGSSWTSVTSPANIIFQLATNLEFSVPQSVLGLNTAAIESRTVSLAGAIVNFGLGTDFMTPATNTAGPDGTVAWTNNLPVVANVLAGITLNLNAGSDTGTVGDHITMTTTPTLEGTADIGMSVNIYQNNSFVTTVTATGGTFSYTIATPLANGVYEFVANGTDSYWNFATTTLTVSVASSIATTISLSPASDSGTKGDLITNNTTPSFNGTATGTAASGASVTLIVDGVNVGVTQTTNGVGVWSLMVGTALTGGPHSVLVMISDVAGNTANSTTLNVIIATSISTSITLSPTSDTGAQGDLITSVRTPTLTGTAAGAAPGGASLGVLVDGVSAAGVSGTTDGSGAWSLTLVSSLSDGTHNISVVVTDVAGNMANSVNLTINIVTAVSTSIVLQPACDSGVSNSDGITNNTQPTFEGVVTGVLSSGAIVELYFSTTLVANGTANGTGHWSLTPSTTYHDTGFGVTASVLDGAGNTFNSSVVTIIIANTISAEGHLVDDNGTPHDNITSFSNPSFGGNVSGMYPSGAIVTFIIDGVPQSGPETMLASPYAFIFAPSLPGLSDGKYNFSVSVLDVAGNLAVSNVVQVQIAAQGLPAINISLANASDTGVQGDNITSNSTPNFEGTATGSFVVGATVTLSIDSVNDPHTTVVDSNGNWNITVSSVIADGSHQFKAMVMDTAGFSGESSVLDILIDTSSPVAAPPQLQTYIVAGVTHDSAPFMEGTVTGGNGGTIEIYVNGTLVATTNVNGSGGWSDQVTLGSEGVYSVIAIATSLNGVRGPNSTVAIIIVDQTAPSTTLVLNGTSPTNGAVINFTGVLSEIPCNLMFYSNLSTLTNQTIGVQTAASSSLVWSFSTNLIPEGAQTISVVPVDAAGNYGNMTAIEIVVDRTLPICVALSLAPSSDTGAMLDGVTSANPAYIGGTVSKHVIISVWMGTTLVGTATSTPNHQWTYGVTESGTYTISCTDDAGNTATSPASLTIDIDQTPPVFTNCSSDITVHTRGDNQTVSWPTPTANDTRDGVITVPSPIVMMNGTTLSTMSGDEFAVGTTSVSYKVKDVADNVAYCNFSIIVIRDVDCSGSYAGYGACDGTCTADGVSSNPYTITVSAEGDGMSCPPTLTRACSILSTCSGFTVTDRKLTVSFTLNGPITTSTDDLIAAITSDVAGALNISTSRIYSVTITNPTSASPTVTLFILDFTAIPNNPDHRSLNDLETDLDRQANDSSSAFRNGEGTTLIKDGSMSTSLQSPSPDKKKSCPGDFLSFDFSGCWWIYVVVIVGIILVLGCFIFLFVKKCRRKPKSQAIWGPAKEKPEEYEIDFAAGDHHDHGRDLNHDHEPPPALPDIELNHQMSHGGDDESIVID